MICLCSIFKNNFPVPGSLAKYIFRKSQQSLFHQKHIAKMYFSAVYDTWIIAHNTKMSISSWALFLQGCRLKLLPWLSQKAPFGLRVNWLHSVFGIKRSVSSRRNERSVSTRPKLNVVKFWSCAVMRERSGRNNLLGSAAVGCGYSDGTLSQIGQKYIYNIIIIFLPVSGYNMFHTYHPLGICFLAAPRNHKTASTSD